MMMQKRRILVGLGAILLCAFFTSVIPLVYYSSQLPSNDQVKAGASLRRLFSDFQQPFYSSISSSEIRDKIICMNCLPEKIGSDGCKDLMASFIARKLIEPQSMLLWHLKNAYLAKAIRAKYDAQTVTKIYFAFVAWILQEVDIDSVCKKEFGKDCNQLATEELITLQRGIASGKFPPEHGPSENSLQSCL